MKDPRFWLAAWVLLASLAAFAAYGLDKQRARRKQWRIRESWLLFLAFAGGAPGAWVGMEVFRHKTRKMKFRLLVPAACVLWLAAAICIWKEGIV